MSFKEQLRQKKCHRRKSKQQSSTSTPTHTSLTSCTRYTIFTTDVFLPGVSCAVRCFGSTSTLTVPLPCPEQILSSLYDTAARLPQRPHFPFFILLRSHGPILLPSSFASPASLSRCLLLVETDQGGGALPVPIRLYSPRGGPAE